VSRPSEGNLKMARVMPAPAYESSVARSALAPNTETEIVPGSRPARAARAFRSARPGTIASALRPRGNQPSQKSTTRCSVCPLSPPSSTGG